ncbi:MAG: outer membrane protein transport protein [Robiginitomaculum sp.]|nr:outer membrane protein transport protein [Robiginitomaculum sp.]
MLNKHMKKITLGLALASSVSLLAVDAFATEGYFTNGSGARNKAMAGAGVADGRDATALITNPAGMVGNGTDLTVSVSLFSPNRRFTGTGGPGFTPVGEFKSSENLFAIPNIAFVKAIDDTSSWGISMAANGGMNTSYRDVTNPACVSPPLPASNGVFCGGTTGVNLSQALISVGYAKKFGNFSIGIAPIFAFQMFEATGLFAFGGVSSSPGSLSNNGTDTATGFGGKIGAQYALTENIRIAGMYQSKIDMSKFDKYAGLFADGGDFDIPSNFQIGISADVSPTLTVSVDYRRINYSDVPAVSNSSRIPLPFGAPGAGGFGWDDIDVIKFGAEWRANDQWTLRAGFSANSQPISGEDVTLNILAPGVTTKHITAGGAYALNDRHSFEFGVMYAPTDSVSGIEITPNGPNPGRTITIEMKQFEATFGWKMKFGR